MNAQFVIEEWAGAIGVPVLRKSLDAADLSAEKQSQLDRLVQASKIADLPAPPPAPKNLRDVGQTKIVLDIDGHSQTVRVSRVDVPSELQRLIDFLKDNGRDARLA